MTDKINEMNENKSLAEIKKLDGADIDRKNYSSSLAEAGLKAGLMTDAEFDRLKTRLLQTLAEVIGYYTKSESSSVKADTAAELSESIIYNIDTYLLSLADDEKALIALREKNPSDLYGQGYLINKKIYDEAKILYGKARLSRLKNASENYNKTLDKYFRYYLTTYSPKFLSHMKIYLTLPEYSLSGAYHIDEAADVLRRICEINRGPSADYVIDNTHVGE